ncbi:MAG: hypothetical protein K0R44_1240, partial [Thermomicrobiales bacterium]|nr:hypothetical protein [Thermomicrobiales bacterium]
PPVELINPSDTFQGLQYDIRAEEGQQGVDDAAVESVEGLPCERHVLLRHLLRSIRRFGPGGAGEFRALANVPVVLSGVGVMPGQYGFANRSGTAMIPDVQIEEVLAERERWKPRTRTTEARSTASDCGRSASMRRRSPSCNGRPSPGRRPV